VPPPGFAGTANDYIGDLDVKLLSAITHAFDDRDYRGRAGHHAMELLDGMTLKPRIGGDKVVHVEGHYGIAFRCS
jgi:hypothetical protein